MTHRIEPVSPLVRAAAIEPAMRRRVALVLAAFQDRYGRDFPASLGRQEELVGLSPEKIRSHIQALEALGVLQVNIRADSTAPTTLPGYQFDEARLRALSLSRSQTADLFGEALAPRMPFLAADAKGRNQLMAMELHGQPGQRTLQFFLEGNRGDVPYGWGPLSMLLLPSFAKGAWVGALKPNPGAPAWARTVQTHPDTVDELRQWAQVLALGRPENMSDLTPIQKHSQKQKGTADGH